jgi:hypothetical protein
VNRITTRRLVDRSTCRDAVDGATQRAGTVGFDGRSRRSTGWVSSSASGDRGRAGATGTTAPQPTQNRPA